MSKKVTIKIVEQGQNKQKRCLMKAFPDSKVSQLKKDYLNIRDKENESEYVFVMDGKGLLDDKTFLENGISKPGMTYLLDIALKKDVKSFNEIKKPDEPKPIEAVKVKIKIQEKVENQMLGADIEATSVMQLEKITIKKYNPADYLFACNGVVLDPTKPLHLLGIGKTKEDAGKVYVVSVHHKDKVKIQK